jgi:type 1 glutamine amidotransferase
MCSDDAAWFATVVGAAKQHGEMNWSRGLLELRVVDREHPVTQGLADFAMDDEAFFLLRQAPEMHALLESPLPTKDEVVPQAWAYETTLPGGRPYRSFVWMQGHYTARLMEPGNRDLILRAIAWAGRRPAGELLEVRPPGR